MRNFKDNAYEKIEKDFKEKIEEVKTEEKKNLKRSRRDFVDKLIELTGKNHKTQDDEAAALSIDPSLLSKYKANTRNITLKAMEAILFKLCGDEHISTDKAAELLKEYFTLY